MGGAHGHGAMHLRRQRAILKAHPSVKKLYGYDSRTQYYAYAVILLQASLAYAARGSWWTAVALGCTIGPYVDNAALCLIHEATHMLVFATPSLNRLLSIATNAVMVMPVSEIFKQHHYAHHKGLGDDDMDVDCPTDAEIAFVGNSSVLKALWLAFNMIILPARSLTRLPVRTDRYLILNWATCLGFGLFVFLHSPKSLLFLLLSTLQSQGLHPANTRQVQRHIYDGDERMRAAADNPMRPPTYSYYGPVNSLTLNVGWHVEHHDFPRIPWTRLPALRAAAGPKWYPDETAHLSRGVSSLYNFVTNPHISLADFAH